MQQLWYCLYTSSLVISTSTQSLDKSRYLKVGLEDACEARLLLSANQSERSFQSEFSGHTIFTFHSKEEHVLLTQ